MKITVVQYMYGKFEYYRFSERINKRYCNLHGYRHVIRRDKPRSDRHVCWHKIPVFIEELRDCDLLVLLDADAVFYGQDLTIEEELLSMMGERCLLMSQDVASEKERWTPGLPNTGVIAARNTPLSFEILRAWDAASDVDPETRWRWPPEQLGLWRHIVRKYEDHIRIVEDYYRVHGRYGQYIRHFFQSTDEERTFRLVDIDKRQKRLQERRIQSYAVNNESITRGSHRETG